MSAETPPESWRPRSYRLETCAPRCALRRFADRTYRSWFFRLGRTWRSLFRHFGRRGSCVLAKVERLQRQQDDHFFQSLEVCRRPQPDLLERISWLDLSDGTDREIARED